LTAEQSIDTERLVHWSLKLNKYKYNSYFYCALYSLTDGALQKSANTCFTAADRLK